jgi:protein SCO1
MRRFPALIALITVVILAVTITLLLSSGGSPHDTSPNAVSTSEGSDSASGLEGSLLPAHLRASEFTLRDQDGRRVSLRQYRGQVVILTFLSSACGGPCVVLANQIRGALDELHQSIPALAVSTDPSTDTRGADDRFLRRVSLTGRMHFLTGTTAELQRIWRAYGIASTNTSKVTLRDGTPLVLLIDKRGFERVSLPLEQLTPEALAQDIRKLLAS